MCCFSSYFLLLFWLKSFRKNQHRSIWMNVNVISKRSGFNCNSRKMDVCFDSTIEMWSAHLFIIQCPYTETGIYNYGAINFWNNNEYEYNISGTFLLFYFERKTKCVYSVGNSLRLTSLLSHCSCYFWPVSLTVFVSARPIGTHWNSHSLTKCVATIKYMKFHLWLACWCVSFLVVPIIQNLYKCSGDAIRITEIKAKECEG